jgi:hypothetical protein
MQLHTVTKSTLRETVRLLSSTRLRSVEARFATTEMETTMNTRQLGIFGLAALGLALAVPVQAAPDFMEGAFIVAQRDRDEVRPDKRDARKDVRPEDAKRRAPKREAASDEPEGYGYGYERRQQQQPEEDSRSRGRR